MRKFYRVYDGVAVRVKGPVCNRTFYFNRPATIVPSRAFRMPAQRPVLCGIPF